MFFSEVAKWSYTFTCFTQSFKLYARKRRSGSSSVGRCTYCDSLEVWADNLKCKVCTTKWTWANLITFSHWNDECENVKGTERFLSRGQQPCKFIGTKESVFIWKEFNSHNHRNGLGHQHGRRFIVLRRQYGRCHVMWKHFIPDSPWKTCASLLQTEDTKNCIKISNIRHNSQNKYFVFGLPITVD